jgi:serine kinase of HPr protein (carbohydrate metabolism regulator)
MTIREIIEHLGAEVLHDNRQLDREIKYAFAADLMSDVLRIDASEIILITGLANPQVVRTAEMSDIPSILFVRGKPVTPAMVALAEESGIALLRCDHSMFKTCGELYVAGLQPVF